MMGLFPSTGIFIATAPVDQRKAFDGLAALVRQSLGHDPLSGSVYVFGNKRKDRIKILFWEPGGYWLCMRRLEQGSPGRSPLHSPSLRSRPAAPTGPPDGYGAGARSGLRSEPGPPRERPAG